MKNIRKEEEKEDLSYIVIKCVTIFQHMRSAALFSFSFFFSIIIFFTMTRLLYLAVVILSICTNISVQAVETPLSTIFLENFESKTLVSNYTLPNSSGKIFPPSAASLSIFIRSR